MAHGDHRSSAEEEFRRVAEDLRALARSLGKDFREAVDQSRRAGHGTSEAFKHGLRGMADEAKRSVRYGWPQAPRHGCWGGSHRPWSPPPPPPGAAGPTPGTPGGGGPTWTTTSRGRPPGPPRAHRTHQPLPPIRRRWDATTVLGVLAVLFGVAWLLGALHVVHVSIEAVVAIGLMLLGASLVVTGRTDWSLSRRGWPVWLGGGLILVLIVTSSTFGVGNAIGHMSIGDTTKTAAAGQTIYGGIGKLTVDASGLSTGGTVHINSVAGETFVAVPQQTNTRIDAHVAAGQVCVNGSEVASGPGISPNITMGDPTGPTLTLDIHQTFGQVVVGNPGCTRAHHR